MMTTDMTGTRRGLGASILVGLTLAVVAANANAQSLAGENQPVTFAKDVAPILQQKCQLCHRPGSMAPMALLTFEDARPWARAIRERVVARTMPPWHLDKTVGIQKFLNDRSLTDREIDTIVTWVDAGAPRGNPEDLPPPKQWPSDDRFRLEETLGPPDLVVKAQPFTMPADSPDLFYYVPAVTEEIPLTEGRWVQASETKPSLEGRRIAHHASVRVSRPQTPEAIAAERAMRRGQPNVDAAVQRRRGATVVDELFTEWAQGKGGEIFPDEVGKLLMPGMTMRFSVHYHAVGEDVTDQLEVGLWFYPKGVTPKYSAEYTAVGVVKELQIPPHAVTAHVGTTVIQHPAMLHNFQPHMHYRGKAQLLEAIYPDGRREVINQVLNFSNDWHINYIYDPDYAPVFPKGTVLMVTAWHDNTVANRNNPDPRQWVGWGDRTVDDMALLNEQIIYITEEDYERIVEERRARAAVAAAAGQ